MTQEQLFEIAKILDNEYIAKEKSFTAIKQNGYWYLKTNKCDWAAPIKIWEKNNKISSIEILLPDSEGWQSITPNSWARVNKYLESLNSCLQP